MSSLPILSSESLPCSTMEPELMHNPDHRDFPFLDDRHQSVSSNQLKQQSTSEEQQNDENEEIVEEINIHSLQSLILRNPISFSDHLNFNTNVIKTPSLLNLSFNQDYSCFAVGTDCGFRFYTSDPYRETIRREFNRGIAIVTSLLRSGIFVIVGGGPHPVFPPNQAVIWDDAKGGCIGELSFRSEIRAVQLRRDRIIIVLEQNIFVYSFMGLKLIHQIETILNPKGLCEVSQMLASLVLVCPGLQKGHIRIENYTDKKTKFIFAHDSEIACLALTLCGQFLASASSKGTLIRVFNTADGTLLQEVRRGASRADIYSLAFSSNVQWLVASSDKGTIHVFSINARRNVASNVFVPAHHASPTIYSLSIFKGVLPRYFRSEWSVAQFRLPEGTQYIAAFGHKENTVLILGRDGSFYRCEFDPDTGGVMKLLEHNEIFEQKKPF